VILNVTNPAAPAIYRQETFGGTMTDVEDVVVGSTNASLFAYVADGVNGMKVLQLTSPRASPTSTASARADARADRLGEDPVAAIAMSKGLDRDRAVDETGGQIAVFGRLGSRPFTRSEMERLFLTRGGVPWKVSDEPDMAAWVPGEGPRVASVR
jgi:hypothetical protein